MKKIVIFSVIIGTLSSGAMAQRNNRMGDLLDSDFDGRYNWSKFSCSDYRSVEYRGSSTRARLNCRSAYDTQPEIEACRVAKKAVIKAAVYRIADKATKDGVLAGYNCGVDKGINAGNNYRNKRDGMENFPHDYRNEILNDKYGTLNRFAAQPATSAAIGQAENDVVSRFRSAVREEGGALPSSTPGTPRLLFNGLSDGYNKNGHSVPSVDSILQASYDNQYIELDSYFSHDFGHNEWRESERRFRRSRRGMRQSRGLPTNREANQTWRRIVGTKGRYLPRPLAMLVREYKQLSSEKIVKTTTETFQPAALADGTVPPLETREKSVISSSPQGIFSEIFAKFWESSLTDAYNRIVERNLDNGFVEGFPLGEEAGAKYAIELGIEEEYNKQYQAESITRYAQAFQPTYVREFGINYNEMSNKSVLQNLHWEIVEDDSDGALLQGERLSFEFGLTNIGGKGKRIGVNAGVNDSENQNRSAYGYDVTALSQKSFRTDSFVILPENEIGIDQKETNIQISFGADGHVGSKVVTIFKPVGFENGSPRANLQTSELIVPVTISNPKNIASSESVVVSMYMNGQKMDQNFDNLPSGTQNINFKVKKDFFEMLGQTYNFKVELSYGGEVIQSRENLSVTINQKNALVEYFDYLVLNRNAVLPSTFDAQFARYRAQIKAISRAEISPMIPELNELGHVNMFSSKRSDITDKYEDLYKLNRSDNTSVSGPGILTQLYLKRVGNDNKRTLKKLDKKVQAAYKSLASDGLVMIYQLMTELDDRHRRSYRNGVCHLAQQLVSLLSNKTRSTYGDKASYQLSKKQKFSCEY